MTLQAWVPNAEEREAAIDAGDLVPYFTKLTAWLDQQVPAVPNQMTTEKMLSLMSDKTFMAALAERQFLTKLWAPRKPKEETGYAFHKGVQNFGLFSKADPKNKQFLRWIMSNAALMNEACMSCTPSAWHLRHDDSHHITPAMLEEWKKIYYADPSSRQGLYLRLAVACIVRRPGTGNQGSGNAKEQSSIYDRYEHFRKAHAAGELFPSFDSLNMWELTHVVSSGASNEDLAWGREALNTWNPSLKKDENVVAMVSQVWRRPSPISYHDFSCVAAGGGKCGPRSSFGVFICQAFGIPAIGVAQPAHAAIAYRDPKGDWQIGQGRSWQVSQLINMPGPAFLDMIKDRKTGKFDQVEHLRWIAALIESPGPTPYEVPKAIMSKSGVKGVVPEHRYANPRADTVFFLHKQLPATGGGIKATPLDKRADQAAVPVKPAIRPEAPIKVPPGVIHVEAEDFFNQGNAQVMDCYTGGKQVYYPSSAWTGYKINVPKTGTYQFTARVAVVNWGQELYVRSFGAMYRAKAAKASDVYRQDAMNLGPQLAIDNDLSTRWAMNLGKDKGWIEIDLGQPREISKIIIDERALNNIKKHTVEYMAGSEWRTLLAGDYVGNYVKSFAPVTAQFVKFSSFDTGAPTGGPTIREISLGTAFDGNGYVKIPWSPGTAEGSRLLKWGKVDGLAGRWQTTPPLAMDLVKGEQTIWVSTQPLEAQRSLSMRWFELKQ